MTRCERDRECECVCVREELIYIIRGVERERKVFGKRAVGYWEIFEI